ncbi:MAG: guanylate kinase [Calditrichia bacterium]
MSREGQNKGARLVAFSAPSGSGKSTICRLLLDRNPRFRLSISATTRSPRHNEENGVHYFFLSMEDFKAKVEAGEFLEYEEVFGRCYGTLKSTVDSLLEQRQVVLFDIDVKGALNVRKAYPDALLVFIKPPSLEELKRRLIGRNTDKMDEIERRLKRIDLEYEVAKHFDHVIINDDLDSAVSMIEDIIAKHPITSNVSN